MKPELLKLLRCPQTRSELVFDNQRLVNTDPQTRLAYPIYQNIPTLVPDQAAPLSVDEWKTIMQRQNRHPETGTPVTNA